jgi:hypothetical protein
MRRSTALAALVLIGTALPLSAQTTYALGRDTLRYHEVFHADVKLVGPQGEIPIKSDHEATIAMTHAAGDTTRAWFEALSLGVSGAMGEQKPATASVLRAPYQLRVDPRGRVNTLSTPAFPAEFEGIADLSHQFDDFFLRLPAKPLRVGLAWSDTVVRTDSTATKFMRWHAQAAYKVERDTVVDGVAALVVSMNQQVEIRSDAPMRDQPMRVESSMTGTENGYFVFAPRAGRVLARRRTGKLDGDLMLHGGQEMSMKQSFDYSSSLDALK